MRNCKATLIILGVFLVALMSSCQKEKQIKISTTRVSGITDTSALVGGIVTENAEDVTSRGICYSSSNNLPTVGDKITYNGAGAGEFISKLMDLTPNTCYYARAYALNSNGVAFYGETVSFTTLGSSPSAPSTMTELLCNPNGWILTEATSSPAYIMSDGCYLSNLFDGFFFDFEYDDVFLFKENGMMIGNPGNLLPPPGFTDNESAFPYVTSEIGSWYFHNDSTCITMQVPFFYDEVLEKCQLLSLTQDEFKVSLKVNFADKGQEYTFYLRYVPANSPSVAAKTSNNITKKFNKDIASRRRFIR